MSACPAIDVSRNWPHRLFWHDRDQTCALAHRARSAKRALHRAIPLSPDHPRSYARRHRPRHVLLPDGPIQKRLVEVHPRQLLRAVRIKGARRPRRIKADRSKWNKPVLSLALTLNNNFSSHLTTSNRLRRALRRRQVAEANTGRLKSLHRLCRNFLARIVGDKLNVILAAAGNNFREWLRCFCRFLQTTLFLSLFDKRSANRREPTSFERHLATTLRDLTGLFRVNACRVSEAAGQYPTGTHGIPRGNLTKTSSSSATIA